MAMKHNRYLSRLGVAGCFFAFLLGGSSAFADEPQFKALIAFSGGEGPYTGLIEDGTGAVIGVPGYLSSLGDYPLGAIYQISPPSGGEKEWHSRTLKVFLAGEGSPHPGDLTLDAAGTLIGITFGGQDPDEGSVFQLLRPAEADEKWNFHYLHDFSAGQNGKGYGGEVPPSAPIPGASGAFYGVTRYGGTGGGGVVYELAPPATGGTVWKETVLYNFGTDYELPEGRVALDAAGNLYGSLYYGGKEFKGAIYELSPPSGGHTVWKLTILHTFSGGIDGVAPEGGVVLDASGNVYAAAGAVLVRLSPPAAGETRWTYTRLRSGGGGNGPLSIGPAGQLYGTSEQGGGGEGYAYELAPPAAGQTEWKYRILHEFTGGADGGYPISGLVVSPSGVLYGTTTSGCKGDSGGLFEIIP